ncbi:MAG: phage portal protein [Gammaproteobacteria bacterium]|nr:phage portal protein [Gammaproteobacteria bacterium]
MTESGWSAVTRWWIWFYRKPNAMMTAQEFREAMTCQLSLWGNAYAKIEWLGDRPVSLIPLKPEGVTPVRVGGEITYHVATGAGITVLAKRSVLHLKGFGTDGIDGLSPWPTLAKCWE